MTSRQQHAKKQLKLVYKEMQETKGGCNVTRQLTLYTFPKAPSPSSPIISHISSGLTSLCTCSYCFFFLSGPSLKILRKLKKDIFFRCELQHREYALFGYFRQENIAVPSDAELKRLSKWEHSSVKLSQTDRCFSHSAIIMSIITSLDGGYHSHIIASSLHRTLSEEMRDTEKS